MLQNKTNLSSDEVELSVTLHTSRALEDRGRGKQDVTQQAELKFHFQGCLEQISDSTISHQQS